MTASKFEIIRTIEEINSKWIEANGLPFTSVNIDIKEKPPVNREETKRNRKSNHGNVWLLDKQPR